MSDGQEWNDRLVEAGCIDDQGEVRNAAALRLVQELKDSVGGLGGRLNQALEELAQLRADNSNLTEDIAAKRRKIKRLLAEEDRNLRHDPLYSHALLVLEHWRDLCHPGARELGGGERMRKVLARLHGRYTTDQLKRCAWGYSCFAYVIEGRRMTHGSPARRFIDAELVYRDPKHVDQGLALADEADRRTKIMPEVTLMPASGATVMLSQLGQAAVKVATFGWYVFPCAPLGKAPVTKHGLLDATRDIDRITRFWMAHPNHNIGVRCGVESEIIVLDVDGTDGLESLRELEREHGTLPATLSVKTPRGGSHMYWRHPGGEIKNTTGWPGLALDIRGDGGYCLVPPSVGENMHAYELDEQVAVAEMPGWLIQMLIDRQTAYERIDPSKWEEMITNGVKEGQRDNQLTRLVGYLWHRHEPELVLGLTLSVNAARCSPPLPRKDVQRIVDSIGRREAAKRVRSTQRALESRQDAAA